MGDVAGARVSILLSRKSASHFAPAGESAIVAIRDAGTRALDLRRWSACLHLEFDDIDEMCAGYQMFSHAQARSIAAFVREHAGATTFAAHCEQGVSRSAAVARFAAMVTDRALVGDAGGYNRLVFSRLMRAWAMLQLRRGRFRSAWQAFLSGLRES